MEILLNPTSESEALRKCNLPSTPRWRDFLRSKLPHGQSGNGRVYNGDDVDELARRVADFARETAQPGEQVSTPTLTSTAPARRTKGQLIDRRGPSA